MKRNYIEDWDLMPTKGQYESQGWCWIGWVGGNAHYQKNQRIAALSAHVECDEKRWLHLSVSHKHQVPSYQALINARLAFLGDILAYQLFVPSAEHVNIHPNCLHLWAPVDHRPTPDFRNITGGNVAI